MAKVNFKLLPIKAHYFFFFAAMGPILPFLPVFGKHLGVSEVIVGSVNGIIPLLFLALKPFFGYLIDYFQERRKLIFMSVILLMGLSFILMGFIPDGKEIVTEEVPLQSIQKCHGKLHSLVPVDVECKNLSLNLLKGHGWFCSLSSLPANLSLTCRGSYSTLKPGFYSGISFWAFVVLMTLGTIGYNVSNSISDAVCFDLLGPGNETQYGKQRVWGAIGFGFAALAGGYFMSIVVSQADSSIKDFFPAFCVCGLCVIVDLACCRKLKLPPLPKSESIVQDIWSLAKQPHVSTFLIFAVLVGICDSSIFFFLLWYLEDMAKESVVGVNIKLLEGLTVAAETLVGEVVSFYLSGKVLSKLGYGHSLSLCFLFYALRLGLIAIIPSPWWVVPIELVMQGPTYALCYSTIVAYASAISPPGTSATVQGIVAGMDDGFGFAVGNFLCSIIYKFYGGRVMFASIAVLAFSSCLVHALLYSLFFRNSMDKPTHQKDRKKGESDEVTKDPEACAPLNTSSS